MDWKQIVGVMLFGSIPSFLPLWFEDMWPVGSWQWGALTFGCLIVGIVLINWDRWSVSFPKISWASYIPKIVIVDEDGKKSSFREIFRALMPAAALLFMVVLVAKCVEIPEWYWSHPDRSATEADSAARECEMKAYEALGRNLFDRHDYINACMESQGFIRRKVEL